MKKALQLRIWQIMLPFSVILIFAIGGITTIYMVNGQYLFDLEITRDGLRIITDIDKKQNSLNNHAGNQL